jgi:hypothetical protein
MTFNYAGFQLHRIKPVNKCICRFGHKVKGGRAVFMIE